MTDNPTDTPASTDIVPDWLIPSRVYDILKWLGLIVLPALALFVGTVGSASSPARSSASAPSNNALTSPRDERVQQSRVDVKKRVRICGWSENCKRR